MEKLDMTQRTTYEILQGADSGFFFTFFNIAILGNFISQRLIHGSRLKKSLYWVSF